MAIKSVANVALAGRPFGKQVVWQAGLLANRHFGKQANGKQVRGKQVPFAKKFLAGKSYDGLVTAAAPQCCQPGDSPQDRQLGLAKATDAWAEEW